ncbi:MAG: alkylation repair protein [Rickettsiaceae bacterium]|jgi:3-methyladenine DNA glycosylase AlkC|nr:alkylation repair protein [Rickettsiaceae bacterium]
MPAALKEVYSRQFSLVLAKSIKKSYPEFKEKIFLALIFDDYWEARELKQRMRHISFCLNQTLTDSYPENIQILKQIANDPALQGKMSSLSLMIFSDYVEAFGLNDLEISLDALEFFTEYGSGEFAIRHLLVRYENQVLERMLKWAVNDNHHVRRLASEGCRPRLPWGIALPNFKNDPSPIIPILEILKNDESEYVRRSVANNLNDISKDNPQIAFDLAKKWLAKNASPDLEKLVKHGLRGLLKKGDKRALALFGLAEGHQIELKSFDLEKSVIKIAADLGFSFQLNNPKKNKIRLEYAIYFLMKNGKFSKKIFQIGEKNLEAGVFVLKKRHCFRLMSTRKYYTGLHKIVLILNGQQIAEREFNLI